jgi:hypothetical protein
VVRGPAVPARAVERADAEAALADEQAVKHVRELVSAGDGEGHSQESLLIGTVLALSDDAQECAHCQGCPNNSDRCRARRAKGHCPMHTVMERVGDLKDLYGVAFTERVLETLQ